MSTRVIASEQARTAAQELGKIIHNDLSPSLIKLREVGQTLSNPTHWDSQFAREFRSRQWPEVNRAITVQMQEMVRLRSSVQKVVQDILTAGNGGAVSQAKSATVDFAKNLYDIGKTLVDHHKPISFGMHATQYATWLTHTLKARNALAAIHIPGRSLPEMIHGIQASLDKLESSTAKAANAMMRLTGKFVPTDGAFAKVRNWWGGLKLGKFFIPLTIATGAVDAIYGGGYSGWRGGVTRVMGGLGVVGGIGMLALASNPVGWGIAAGAVVAYGAWSLGNLIYDNREAIGRAATAAWNWTKGAVGKVTQSLGHFVTAHPCIF